MNEITNPTIGLKVYTFNNIGKFSKHSQAKDDEITKLD
jgi:hypothetical protein